MARKAARIARKIARDNGRPAPAAEGFQSIVRPGGRPAATNMPPVGSLPLGTQMKAIHPFSPELQAALQNVRENADGRFLVIVIDADDPDSDPHNVRMHVSRGGKWQRGWWLRAYDLIVAEMLKVNPPAASQPPPQAPLPPIESVSSQAESGGE